MSVSKETIAIEIDLLLQSIKWKYGYDYTNYSLNSIERKIKHRLKLSALTTISQLQSKVLHDPAFFEAIVQDFSINVTEMFRDPGFYQVFRQQVVQLLKSNSFIRIWVAGCSTGEEVYSMAIILKEAGIYDKTQLYATDINESVINIARKGIYTTDKIKKYTDNYQQSGGQTSFSDYYTADNKFVVLDASLRKNIIFSTHNLVSDTSFNEMQLISCRNVMIYFNQQLTNDVLLLLTESLSKQGLLCLGDKESLRFSCVEKNYEIIDKKEKIYRRI